MKKYRYILKRCCAVITDMISNIIDLTNESNDLDSELLDIIEEYEITTEKFIDYIKRFF